MSAKSRPDAKFDDLVKAYTLMSRDEIDAELKSFGIDPRPTIESVKALVLRRQDGLPAFLRTGRRNDR